MSLPRNYVLCRLSRSLIFVVSIIYKFLLLLIVLWWYSLSNISKTLVEALSNSYFNYCNAFSLWVVFCWFSLVVWFFFFGLKTSESCSWLLLWHLHSCFVSHSLSPSSPLLRWFMTFPIPEAARREQLLAPVSCLPARYLLVLFSESHLG